MRAKIMRVDISRRAEMPVVAEYASSRELQKVRSIQQMILQNYRRDFSKHAPEREVSRINMVWDSIPDSLGLWLKLQLKPSS